MTQADANATEAGIIKERIDSGGFTFGQYAVVLICFMLNMLDGFDIVAMSAVAPILSDEWGISPQQKGFILSAALVGMTLGAVFLAPLCDKYGRRSMMLAATLVTGAAMLVTALLPASVPLMIVVRIITGLGIGVIMASTTAITTEFTPDRWRNAIIPLVVAGYPFGAIAVGPVANALIPTYGWPAIFYFGGGLTLITAAVMFFFLPESITYLAGKTGSDESRMAHINRILARIKRAPIDALPKRDTSLKAARVSSLLVPAYRRITLTLWIVFFSGLLNMYFLFAWIPSLFVNSGYTRADGNFALTLFNIGGVSGILAIGLITSRVGLARPIAIFFGLTTVAMLYFSWAPSLSLTILNLLILAIGFFFQGGYTGLYTMASRAYPSIIRATGIGWSIGLGRTGAIVAPIVAGYFVSFGWSMYPLFTLFAMPVLLMTVLIAPLKR